MKPKAENAKQPYGYNKTEYIYIATKYRELNYVNKTITQQGEVLQHIQKIKVNFLNIFKSTYKLVSTRGIHHIENRGRV